MVLPKADQRPPSSSATALVEEQRAGRESVVSSKAEKFPARPSFGTVGKRCRVRANHFLVQVANQDIHHYDVAIFPETRSRDRNRSIVNELVRLHRQYLDGRLPVYDGRKNIYTAGALPFKNKEFVVKLANAARGHQREEEYKVTIQHASKLDLYNLQQFLAGRHRELPQDTIQALDIALRESPAAEYLSISRSFFSQSFGHGGPIGNGVECWRGYYQSLRPTQLELSLNIDISATAFYKAQPVMDFAIEYLSMRDSSRLFDQDRLKIVNRNNYGNDCYSKEFGMKVTSQLALVDARVLPAPRLKYHESGRDKVCDPFVGQWNMINKSSFIDFIVFPQKFVNGGSVNYWACLTFASHLHPKDIGMFCNDLARMCNSIGMQMNMKPCVDITQPSRQDSVESAIRTIHRNSAQVLAQQGLAGKQLELLIIILPDVSGSYGRIKRLCETELGVITQCCLPRNVQKGGKQYLENLSMKINVKVGGRNTVLENALYKRIPLLTDVPTIVFGADVTHPSPGEDASPSIAAVVASMDWPEVTKYKCLVSSQGHRDEIIADLYTELCSVHPLGLHRNIFQLSQFHADLALATLVTVPPAYYAHLAAFRARYYMEDEFSDQGSSSATSKMHERSTPVRQLPKIKDNVKEFMFYC
ncbi:hypothetical protein ACQ4PT_070874 [Festuca glaucescens]